MNLNEIEQFLNEDSIRGDLAREFAGVINDYQTGNITHQDKDAIVDEIISSFEANGLAQDEVMWRWAIGAASLVAKVV